MGGRGGHDAAVGRDCGSYKPRHKCRSPLDGTSNRLSFDRRPGAGRDDG